MFDTALVASDLSPASDRLVSCLHGLRPLGTRRIVLVHALGLRHLEELKYDLLPLVEPKLSEQKAKLEEQGFETAVRIAPGPPPREIHGLAREEQASLVVVGSHGASLAEEIPLGCVAMATLHHGSLPVLLFRLKAVGPAGLERCEAACTDFRNHVLHPTDFSEGAERAFAYVERIVECGARRVTLLHVQDRKRLEPHLVDRLEEFNRLDRARLERCRAALEAKGASDVRIEVPYGSPIQEILRHAREEDETLIVMGSQGRGFIPEVFLGSVSHHVARQAPVPVLLIPAPRR